MSDIIEIYNNYSQVGIKNRSITEGKEMELVRDYIEYRKSEFKSNEERKLAIFIETKINNSYPDIVFVEYNPENYIKWNNTRDTLTKNDLKILYHVYSQEGLEAAQIVEQLGVTWKETLQSVERLCDSELLIRKFGNWIVDDINKMTTYKIEAVEAKLNHWDQVLQQSVLNKNFASESYALSLIESKPKKEILSKFKRLGVGVYLKDGNCFNVLKQAEVNNIPVSFNSIIFNEWIGRIQNSRGAQFNAVG